MAHADELCTWFRAIASRTHQSSAIRWRQPRLCRHSSSLLLASSNELRVPPHPALRRLPKRYPDDAPNKAPASHSASFGTCTALRALSHSADPYTRAPPPSRLYIPALIHDDSRPPLDTLQRPRLAAYCFTVGYQGLRDRATHIIEHFVADDALSSFEPIPALARRSIALQALVKGAASSPAGVRTVCTPSQLVSIHNILAKCASTEAEAARIYQSLPVESRRQMLEQLCLLRAHFVFPIISALLDEVLTDSGIPDFPTRQEASNIINYLLTPPMRDKGGQGKAVTFMRFTLAERPEFEKTIRMAQGDARTWLGREHTPANFWNLSSRMLALKLSLQAVEFPSALGHCRRIIGGFSQHACDPSIPAYFVLETTKMALETSNTLQGQERPESFEFVETLLSERASEILQAAWRQRGTAPDGKPLDEFCRRSMEEGRYQSCAAVLLLYKERANDFTQLLSPHVLIDLVDSLSRREYDGTQSALVRALLGLGPDKRLPREKWLVSIPFPFMRRVIKVLCRLRLKPQVANLWKFWVSSGGSEAPLLVADASCMQSLVGLFSPATKNLVLPKDSRARQQKRLELSDNKNFASEVLETFIAAKPLRACQRIELTSLASAFFHLGRERQAFAVFTEILHRREVPDQYDVLVILWALARHDLQLAVRLFISRSQLFSRGKEDASTIMRLVHATPAILNMLMVQCFRQHQYDLARLLVTGSRENLQVYRHDENHRFFIVTLHRMFEMPKSALKGSRQQPGRPPVFTGDKWEWFARQLVRRARDHKWQPNIAVLGCLIRAAANGRTLQQQMHASSADAAIAERKKNASRSKKQSTARQGEAPPKPRRRARSTEVGAAVDMLALAARDTRSLVEADLVRLVLGKVDSHARYLLSERSSRERKLPWIRHLDSIVSVIRAMDARFAFRKNHAHATRLPLWPELAADARLRAEALELSNTFYEEPTQESFSDPESGRVADGEEGDFKLLDEEEMSELGATSSPGAAEDSDVGEEWEDEEEQADDSAEHVSVSDSDSATSSSETASSQPSSAADCRPPTEGNAYLHEARFRNLIQTYITLDDIQGASEVFLWMRERNPRFTLGAKLEKRLKHLLGDLRMLYPEASGEARGAGEGGAEGDAKTGASGAERKARPTTPLMSWTFDGRIIERTKPWWKVGV